MKGYYPHGPLQRVELGEYKVQGMDYAYTLQGWLKGINSDRLTPGTDMGQDGLAGTANEFVARDAFGESIGYYGDADYSAIDATRWGGSPGRPIAAVGGTGTLHGAYNPLYNGNIGHTVHSLQPFGGWTSPTQPAQVLAQVYKYDQLNRLKQAQGVAGLTAANTWNGITDAVANRYKSKYTYDANGNIETADRYDETGAQYDNLEYHYEKSGTDLLRNRLYHLNESINGGYGDIGIDGSDFHGDHDDVNLLNNYKYDALGNLIHDKREEIETIEWTVAGKVKHITRTPGSSKPELWFTYGADGQRTSKTVGDPLNGGYREYYLRDAQGNVMAMYKYADNGASLKVTERPVYGSSRLGSYTRQMELVGELTITNYPYTQPMQAPLKRYELTDHLGNVNTVVTGRLLPLLGPGVQYQAEVLSATVYEAFGFALPNRSFQSENYSWGFGGKFMDDEVNGSSGSSLDYGARMRDPRVGPWITLDPLAAKYPDLSPYQFAGNNPILNIDPDGKRIWPVNQRAQDALTSTLTSFAPENKVGDIFGVHISQRTGAFYSNDNGNPISEKAFDKRLRQANVKLDKEQRANAYSTYLAIASSDEIQVEVVEIASPGTTRTQGTPGSIVDGEMDRINANRGLNEMKADIKKSGSATSDMINEAVRPTGGARSGKYSPDAVGDGYSIYNVPKDGDNHGATKTILIDGTGKTNQQNGATLQKALSSEN